MLKAGTEKTILDALEILNTNFYQESNTVTIRFKNSDSLTFDNISESEYAEIFHELCVNLLDE